MGLKEKQRRRGTCDSPEPHAGLNASRAEDARAALAGPAPPGCLSFPGGRSSEHRPLTSRGGRGREGRQGSRARGGRWEVGSETECGAPPGRARRKPGREAGGGAAALSHSRLTRPPLPGAEVTAARDGRPPRAAATACRVAASRDRRAAESRSEDRQGRAGRPGRCPGATSGGDPRPEDVPRGRACATPSPRRPLPRPVTHEGRWGTGPSSEPSAPRPGRVL